LGLPSKTVTIVTEDNETALVQYSLKAKDTGGNEITSTSAGETFVLEAWVDDLRGLPNPADEGVFAAYFDVTFDPAIAAPRGEIVHNTELFGLATDGAGRLPEAHVQKNRFFDVNGDGFLTPNDVLVLVNLLNRQASAEGEWAASGVVSLASRVAAPTSDAEASESGRGAEVTDDQLPPAVGLSPRAVPQTDRAARSADEELTDLETALEEIAADVLVQWSTDDASI
jgi:hypothetical protein